MRKAKSVVLSGMVLFALMLLCTWASAAEEQKKPAVVKVAVNNSFKPIGFIDENGKHTGYDIEVIKEVDRRLPEYEFVLEGQDSTSNLLGVETGKYVFGSSSFFKNPDREKKYLFPDENYGVAFVKIMVKKDRNDINTIDDLAGKSFVPHPPADGIYTIIKNYNDAHPDKQIKLQAIDPASKAPADALKWVDSGRYEAEVIGAYIFHAVQKDLKLDLKLTGTVSKSPMYFVMNKTQTELKGKIDQVLKEMKKDGTLSKLSSQWLGEDVFKE
jgi:L-cystine transport system substrate-binding protein